MDDLIRRLGEVRSAAMDTCQDVKTGLDSGMDELKQGVASAQEKLQSI